MLIHYIRISLRNLNKYKTQTAISILAMAVSLTLLAIVVSLALSIRQLPLITQPYTDRTVELRLLNDESVPPGSEEMTLISGHQFSNMEENHFIEWGYGISANIMSNPGEDNERSLMNDVFIADNDYLKFQGIKSSLTGKTIDCIADDETVITKKLARKLFGKENPIGKGVFVHSDYFGNKIPDKIYTIKDVMEDPTPFNKLFNIAEGIFIAGDQFFPNTRYQCFFVLKQGKSPDALKTELQELMPGQKIELTDVKKMYSSDEEMAIRNGIILFLIVFVLVAYSNYLRLQLQLFRFREREVALRTCLGSMPGSLPMLFSMEIFIVLLITMALTLALISVISDFLIVRYPILFDSMNFSLSDAVPITLFSIAALAVISLAAVALIIKRIRRNQTGLALRMKPLPKHRLRNVGLTLQMTVCIVFTCITVLFFMSGNSIKERFGIPDNLDRYRRSIIITRLPGIEEEEQKVIYDRIESLESIETVYKFSGIRRMFPFDIENNDQKGISILVQEDTDGIDFYELKSTDINKDVNPDKYVLVSKSFRQALIDKNIWNGKTLDLPYMGEYEIKGVYDYLPFEESDFREGVVIYDVDKPYSDIYYRVIMPKKGMAKATMQDISKIIQDVVPDRIDIKPKNFYNFVAKSYDVIIAMIITIYILTTISVVTSMAAIYAGVSLDTRRRRKEMALRKLNGAGPKVIAMIFTRTYLWILSVAAVISLPICFMATEALHGTMFPALRSDSFVIAYILGLLLIIAITFCTIVWKIRDIMHADPIEYLKE